MSGSSGDGGNGDRDDELNCSTVQFTTALASVQPDVVGELTIGSKLAIIADDGKVLAVLQQSGDVAGSINWAKNGELIRCMDEGYEYIGTVRAVDDGLVKVQVTAA